jgi:EmrB/QacA subfamily drug resistance transporter
MIDSVPPLPPTPRSASVTGHTRGDRGSHVAGLRWARPSTAAIRLALLLVGNFVVVLDFTIVNVALPSIAHDLGAVTSAVQWVVTGYGVAFAGLLILGGRAGDLLGRRRMFITGLTIFALASLAAGLARDLPLLVAARVIQGAGAAVIAPTALALITTSFPEGPARTRAIGLYGSIASIGFVSGQVLGGVLVDLVSWRAVFLVNVPFGLLAAALAPRVITPASPVSAHAPACDVAPAPAAGRAAGRGRLDARGAALVTGAVALVVFGVSQGNALGWSSPLVLGAVAAAIATGACFVAAEARHPAPLVRPRTLLRPGLRNGAALAFLLGVWNGGELLLLSLYMQQALHLSPLATGAALAPQGMAGFSMGILGPKLVARLGARRLATLAGAIAAAGFLGLTGLPGGGYSPLLLVVILVGFGSAGTAFGSLVIATRELGDADQGLAGGVVNTSRQIGAAVGAALLPAVAESMSGGIPGITGDRVAMAAAAAAALLATAVAWHASRAHSVTALP